MNLHTRCVYRMTDENHKMQNTEEPERPFSLTLLIWKMRRLKSYFGLCAESDHRLEAKGIGFNGIRITVFSNAVFKCSRSEQANTGRRVLAALLGWPPCAGLGRPGGQIGPFLSGTVFGHLC